MGFKNQKNPHNNIETNFNVNVVCSAKKNTNFQPVIDEKIEILSIEDLINLVIVCKRVDTEISHKALLFLVKTIYQTSKTKKIRPNIILGTIVRTILERKWLYFNELVPAIGKSSKEMIQHLINELINKYQDKKQKQQFIKTRTLRRYMQKLTDLHWVVRIGKGQLASYWINPFLLALYEMAKDSANLCVYADFGIDFFDLLNLPLLNILNSKKTLKDVSVSFYSFRKDGTFNMFVKEWFRGALFLNFILQDGTEKLTILPVNLHGQQVYSKSENRKRKYRLYEHNCVPIKWQIFDIREVSYFSKKGIHEKIYLHFDTSFSLIADKDSSGKFTAYYFNWIQKWEHAAKKFDGYQYLEFNDFKLLEELFKARFVKQKREMQLIIELGLKVKHKGGRGKKKKKQI